MTALIRPEPQPTYELTLVNAGGERSVFFSSDNHPWFVVGKGWVETINLSVGDRIVSARGADLVVQSLAPTGRSVHTYNLTVSGPHTFLVGAHGAVVHNQGVCPIALARAQAAFPRLAGRMQDHHVFPRFMGGAADGPTRRIDAAYHQAITNRFRELHPYGSGPLSLSQQQAITQQVYREFPLPLN